MSKQTIVVVGSTGKQGGSVARALHKSGEWKVRCLTRNINSQNAKKLKDLGMEVVECDVCKKDMLQSALTGAYGIFAMTDAYDKSCTGEGEYTAGCMIADVAKEKGIKHFVWSSLENANKISKGKYNVPIFTRKARVEDYVLKLGFPITTMVYPGYYMQNFLNERGSKPVMENGKAHFKFHVKDNTKLYLIDIEDLGKVVSGIFSGKDKFNKKHIPIVGSTLTLRQIADQYSRTTGKESTVTKINRSEFEKLHGKEFTEMLDYFEEFGAFNDYTDFETAKRLHSGLNTWDQWIKTNQIL